MAENLVVLATHLTDPDDSDREILIYCGIKQRGGYQVVALDASLPFAKKIARGVEDQVFPSIEAAQSHLAELGYTVT